MAPPTLNPHVAALDTPAIPLALGWADEYDGAYGPLIDLSQAVPNYPPHAGLLDALSGAASDQQNCGYGMIEGEPALREVYARYASQQYQHTIDSTQTHITAGCNQAFFATLMAIATQGDTVLMANPCYFNHEATAKILGIKLQYFDCSAENQFLPDLASITTALDESVSIKVLALVSPNNPTGAIYPPALLDAIYQRCVARGIWLVLDEAYCEFAPTADSPPHLIFQRDWQQNFIRLYSFSKTYCIPGHRLGAVIAATPVIAAIAKVMDNLQICAPRSAQLALASQIETLNDWVAGNNQRITQRAEVFESVMAKCPQWSIHSLGGYFAYIKHPFTGMDAAAVVKVLAGKYGILPLPGTFFGTGQEGYLRIAFANAGEVTLSLLGDRLQQVEMASNAVAAEH